MLVANHLQLNMSRLQFFCHLPVRISQVQKEINFQGRFLPEVILSAGHPGVELVTEWLRQHLD